MKIRLKAHPNSSIEKIQKNSEEDYEVWIKEKAEDNKANVKLVKLLQRFFKKKVKIKSGFTSKKKIMEIEK
jgi:uncharacterized protein (TIGR00251 family)